MSNFKPENPEPDDIVTWTRHEKDRTMDVVEAAESRGILLHAIKRTAQVITGVLSFIIVAKAAGLSGVWNAFITWISQR